jgi:endonuclease VIII
LPEGDTIHRWAQRLDAALTGHTLKRFEFRRDPRGTRLPEAGTTIIGVEARGKHLLVHFGDGATLHTHMSLHGRWDVYQPGQRWRRPSHTARAVIEVDDGTRAVCFAAPLCELRRDGSGAPSTRGSHALDALGPDLSTDDVDLDQVMRRADDVVATAPSAAVVDLLLDQRVASGTGNVFVSEICWACRVHPFTPIAMIDAAIRRSLFETAHQMLSANRATTGRRVTYKGGLAVYGKERRPCPRCATPIAQAYGGAGDRTTFWCPQCQPDGPAEPLRE